MNDQQIRQIVQREIRNYASNARFGLNAIPRHIHNNVDSPNVFQPILTYVGQIAYNGTISLLPQGWTLTYQGTGSYLITHNLNSLLYAVVASAQQSTNKIVATVIESFDNSVDFEWFDTSTQSRVDTSFDFILTTINNKSQSLPLYGGTQVQ